MNALISLFSDLYHNSPTSIEPITGSGSTRRYYRLSDEHHSAIGTIGTSKEENEAFLYLSRHFKEKQLNVPEILSVSADHTAYLQQDLGSLSLYQAISKGREQGGIYSQQEQTLIESAIRTLPLFQTRGAEDLDTSYCYPTARMDYQSIMFDLNYFKYCFLKLIPGIDFHEIRLQADLDRLCTNISNLSATADTLILRDFQARNVMLKANTVQDTQSGQLIRNNVENSSLALTGYTPYFIDYQGCRFGPAEYDVASFLWQASSRYPQDLRRHLVDAYIEAYKKIHPSGAEQIQPRLKLMVLFRLLQVLGAYGYRGIIEKKEYFIRSIPPAIDNLANILYNDDVTDYPYLAEVLSAIVSSVRSNEEKHMATAKTQTPLTVTIYSFSYKKGIPSDESGNGGGYVFDCRSIHNPGRYEQYKHLTGLDSAVIRFLEDDGEILSFLGHIYPLIDHHVERFIERGFSNLMVSFGCTGGQHRSVYCARNMADHLHTRFPNIHIHLIHRERGIDHWL